MTLLYILKSGAKSSFWAAQFEVKFFLLNFKLPVFSFEMDNSPFFFLPIGTLAQS